MNKGDTQLSGILFNPKVTLYRLPLTLTIIYVKHDISYTRKLVGLSL